ncbi:MAG: hypothetical protein EPN37_13560 [Chitinophagaceae bacterium]|nr:MAG: hypothetical protein EPN37_13560 [Chitinophagaceae bacterium]
MARKIIKFIIFFICSLVILFILITLILPSTGKVVKETYIQASKKTVLGELSTLESYSAWYPWIQVDPTAKISYKDNRQQMSWVGKTSPGPVDGIYRLTGLDSDSTLHFEFTYRDTPPFTGAYILRSSSDTSGTTVVWYLKMRAGFTPWWRFYAAMMNKLTGPLMDAGLNNLKIICEKAEVYSHIPVRRIEINKTYVATVMDTVLQSQLYLSLNRSFDSIRSFISDHHLIAKGEPMAQFHELNNHTFTINAGIPVKEKFIPEDNIQLQIFPAEALLSADYSGNYGGVQHTYLVLSHLATHYGKSASPAVWEIYEDGRIPQSDTSYCHIHVCYAIPSRQKIAWLRSLTKR